MQSRRTALLILLTIVSVSTPLRVRAEGRVVLPVRVHVVHVGGEPVADPSFVTAQLERANAIFAPYGVRFAQKPAPPPLHARHAALETRADRDALGAYARTGAIDCFVVRSLRDVDEPERMRHGVHWHVRGERAGKHFVVLSSIASGDVLAHELGHYLGNPRHSETPGNLMSYRRGEQAMPFLDRAQLRRMRAAIARYLRSGELRRAAATAAPDDAAAPRSTASE